MALSLSSLGQFALPQANINSDITGQLQQLVANINKGIENKEATQALTNLYAGALPQTASLAPLGQIAAPHSAAPPSAATVPNNSNAIPGTVGMNQSLADRSQDFLQDHPGTYLSSGVRSTADQARLYADRGNNPNPVAPPGTSRHERGLAVDIGGMSPDQRAQLSQYGLSQPVANDAPHVELASAAGDNSVLPTNASYTQGQLPTGLSGAQPVTSQQFAALAASPATRPLAMAMLQSRLSGKQVQFLQVNGKIVAADPRTGQVADVTPAGMSGQQYRQETDKDGNVWNINNSTGERSVALKADKDQFAIQKVENPDGTTSVVRIKKEGDPGVVDTGQQPQANGANPFSTGGKFNSDQAKAAGFTDRMLQSEAVLSGVGGKGGVQGEGTSLVGSGLDAVSNTPVVGSTPLGALANWAKGDNRQKFEQAKRDFVNAQLRRESGAAISASEFDSANKQYFPVPGDSAAVIAQKTANRRAAVEAMGREGGPSYRPKSSFDQAGHIVSRQLMQISTPQQYQSLPSGTQYVAPDGSLRTKQ